MRSVITYKDFFPIVDHAVFSYYFCNLTHYIMQYWKPSIKQTRENMPLFPDPLADRVDWVL